ncbi:hypothetical protein Salat_1561700 [Sesamum alatum]|uniref:Uncharacterized protein n=1 Tax=Sesamum alatum TaxID=300844 RepID=A0AAE1YD32_9LAMI|nr:hypothetical protein Salat_1561700 [Sesamum alatum]
MLLSWLTARPNDLEQFPEAGPSRVPLTAAEIMVERSPMEVSRERMKISVGSALGGILMAENKAMQVNSEPDGAQNSRTAGFGRGDWASELCLRTREMIIPPIISANRMIKEKKRRIRVLFLRRNDESLSS